MTYVCQDGPSDAPGMLLIHGTGASSRSWDLLVPLLTETHHVIRVDLPGCGRSAKPLDASYAVPDQAARVAAVLDRPVVAVGHSSGGAVVTALAEQRPDLVSALVLIDTGPDMSAYIATDVDQSDDPLRAAISSAFAEGYAVPQSLVDEARGMDLRTFAAISQALRAYLDERSLPDRLAPLGKPLLVIFGDADRRWRPSSAASYQAVPGARIEMLPGVGHTPIIEDPRRTAAKILDLVVVNRVRSSRGATPGLR